MTKEPSNTGHTVMVFIENTLSMLLWVAGALLVYLWDPRWALIFIIWIVGSFIWFLRAICINCPNVKSGRCPSGYNVIVRRLFGFGSPKEFRSAFYRNIWIIFPWWFVPLVVGTYLLIQGMDPVVTVLLAIVALDGFVLIPLISKKVGCRYCSNRNNCPWKKGKGQGDG